MLEAVAPRPTDDDGDEGAEDEEGAERVRQRREKAWEEHWSTQAKRDAQAAKAKAAARTFLAKLALESVYTHYLAKHIETQVSDFGPLWYWSG